MYCRQCGCEISDDAQFCHRCGVAVNSDIMQKTVKVKQKLHLSKRQITIVLSVLLTITLCIASLIVFYPTSQKRVIKALEKLQNSEQLNITINANVNTNYNNEPVTLYQSMKIKSDVSDPKNPLSSMSSTTTVDRYDITIKSYYKDGYSYADTESSISGVLDTKIKTAVDYEDFQNDYLQITKNIVLDPKVDINNAEIEKGEDGNIYAHLFVNGDEFTNLLEKLIEYWVGELTIDINSTNDCYLNIVVDDSNTVTEMRFEYIFTVMLNGTPFDVVYKATFKYNEITDDFDVTFPNDLDSYDLNVGLVADDFAIYDENYEKVINYEQVKSISICEIDEAYYVKITFNDEGKSNFANATSNNVGKAMAICVGNDIIMMPTVSEPITDGAFTIPMWNNYDEAKELFDRLSK